MRVPGLESGDSPAASARISQVPASPPGKRARVASARDPFALSSGLAPARRTFLARVPSQKPPERCSAEFFPRWSLYLFSFARFFMTKLYVGNLPFTATEEAVRNLFAPHGTIEKLSLINDRDTGRPRGFGFVEMPNADASRAMQALNGKDFDGRALKINEAQDKPRSGGGSSRYRVGRPPGA